MELRVIPLTGADTSTPPEQLQLPALKAFEPAARTRQVSLNEEDAMVLYVGPKASLLGVVSAEITGIPRMWSDAITETPLAVDTEIWEIYNFTMDAHPIHLHADYEVERKNFQKTTPWKYMSGSGLFDLAMCRFPPG